MRQLWKLAYSLIILTVCTQGAQAEEGFNIKESRKVSKSIGVSEDASLELFNKYGDIVFNHWDKDSIRVEVEITAEGDDPQAVRTYLEGVDINISGSKHMVIARTEWSSTMGFIRKSMYDIRNSIKQSRRLRINYEVYLPKGVEVRLENHFGNVIIDDHSGVISGEIGHGDFRGSHLSKVRNLKIRFGDLRLKEVGFAIVTANFADVEVENCLDLDITSASSEIMLDEVTSAVVHSKSDKINATSIGTLKGNTAVTDVRIDELKDRLELDTRFGDIRVSKLAPGFQNVNLTGSYTDYVLVIDEGLGGTFTVNLEGGREFTYTSRVTVEDKQESEKTKRYTGKIGQGGDSKIAIRAKSAYVRFNM